MSIKLFYAWQAVLAGAQFAVSGAMLTDLVGPHTAGAVGLVVGSLQVATATWASLTGARLVQSGPATPAQVIGNGQS